MNLAASGASSATIGAAGGNVGQMQQRQSSLLWDNDGAYSMW